MNSEAQWQQLVEAHLAYMEAFRQFWAAKDKRVALIKRGLQQGDYATAMYVLKLLSPEELTDLFDELLKLAIYSHGYGHAARQAIAAMPRDWVYMRVDSAVKQYLQSHEYDVHQGVLELYMSLDYYKAVAQLATEAVQDSNPDIQEVGKDFLERLKKTSLLE